MAKMRTRDLILEVALVLLNECGESIVTSVDLANEMNISPGICIITSRAKNKLLKSCMPSFTREF